MNWTRQTVSGAAIGAGLGAIAGAIGVGGLALVLLAGGVLGGVLASLIGVLGRLRIMDLQENDGYQAGAAYVAFWLVILVASAWLVGGRQGDTRAMAMSAGGPAVRLLEGAIVVAGMISGFVGGLLIGVLARLGALAFLDPGGPRSQAIAKTGRTSGEFILGGCLTFVIGGFMVELVANAALVGLGAGIGLMVGATSGAITWLVAGAGRQTHRVTAANGPLDGTIAGAILGAIVGTVSGAITGGFAGVLVWRPAIVSIGEPLVVAMSKLVFLSIGGAVLGAGAGALLGTSAGAIAGAMLGALSTFEPVSTAQKSLQSASLTVAKSPLLTLDRNRGNGALIMLGAPVATTVAGAVLLAAWGAASGIVVAATAACAIGAAAGAWTWGIARLEAGPLADGAGAFRLALMIATGAALGFVTGAALGALGSLNIETFGKVLAIMIRQLLTSVEGTNVILGEVMRWTTVGALIAGAAAGVWFPAIGRDVSGTSTSPVGVIMGAGAGALGALLTSLGLVLGAVGGGIAWSSVAQGAATGAIALAILARAAAARPGAV